MNPKYCKAVLIHAGIKHKLSIIVYYVPRRAMRVIARRVTMLAGDRSQGVAETKPRRDQSCEHCRESRNFANCVHWHVFYFMCLRRVNSFFRYS